MPHECFNCGDTVRIDELGYVCGDRQTYSVCPTCGVHKGTPNGSGDFDRLISTQEDHPSHVLGADEVRRRVPVVDQIDDYDIRTATIDLTSRAPAYFWAVPASTSDHHHPACRQAHGLWAHTLMGTTALLHLADSYVGQGRLEPAGVDYALAASVLHDQRKNGPHGSRPPSASDHDLRMARVIDEESALPSVVAEAVASHMGPWYDGPEPETPVERLVHDADMMASTPKATLQLPSPVPEELANSLDVEGVGDA